jgi:hypothetical protein
MSRKPKDPYGRTRKQLKEIAKAEEAYYNQKEKEASLLSSLLSINEEKFYPKPWVHALQEKLKKDPNIYKICLKDTMVVVPPFRFKFPPLNTNVYEVILAMNLEEYWDFTRNFFLFLDCIKDSIAQALKECENSNKFGKGFKPYILPTLEEIEAIEKVFEKEAREEYNRNYGKS